MPLYEVFIKPGYSGTDIEAENPKEAAKQFVDMILDNFGEDQVVVNPLDDEEDYE